MHFPSFLSFNPHSNFPLIKSAFHLSYQSIRFPSFLSINPLSTFLVNELPFQLSSPSVHFPAFLSTSFLSTFPVNRSKFSWDLYTSAFPLNLSDFTLHTSTCLYMLSTLLYIFLLPHGICTKSSWIYPYSTVVLSLSVSTHRDCPFDDTISPSSTIYGICPHSCWIFSRFASTTCLSTISLNRLLYIEPWSANHYFESYQLPYSWLNLPSWSVDLHTFHHIPGIFHRGKMETW